MKELKPHPLTETLPMMNEEQYALLKESIKESGQKNPIIIHDGFLIDGRNRLKACQELGIEPKFKECVESEIENIVFIENIAKRCLSSAQRCCVAVEWYCIVKKSKKEILQQSLKARRERIASGEIKSWHEKTYCTKGEEPQKRILEVARKFNISNHGIMKLYSIKTHCPDIFEKVKAGGMSISLAYIKYRESIGPSVRTGRKEEVLVNFVLSNDIQVPNCFESHESIHQFIKQMNTMGWVAEMRIKPHPSIKGQSQYFVNFYGNGFVAMDSQITNAGCEPEFRRAVVVAANEKLNRVKALPKKAA